MAPFPWETGPSDAGRVFRTQPLSTVPNPQRTSWKCLCCPALPWGQTFRKSERLGLQAEGCDPCWLVSLQAQGQGPHAGLPRCISTSARCSSEPQTLSSHGHVTLEGSLCANQTKLRHQESWRETPRFSAFRFCFPNFPNFFKSTCINNEK